MLAEDQFNLRYISAISCPIINPSPVPSFECKNNTQLRNNNTLYLTPTPSDLPPAASCRTLANKHALRSREYVCSVPQLASFFHKRRSKSPSNGHKYAVRSTGMPPELQYIVSGPKTLNTIATLNSWTAPVLLRIANHH